MFKSPFLILAVGGVMAIGGYFLFQNALSQAAKIAVLEQELKQKNKDMEENMKAVKDKDKIAFEEQNLSDDDIIAALIEFGIVRSENDR